MRHKTRGVLTAQSFAWAVFTLAGLAPLTTDAADDAPPRPNIVLILADDLGYGDLGCYGQRHFETPNLDRMAQQGLRFTSHYAGSAVCAPSRACLLTGQHTGHTHVRFNGKVQFREDPLDRTVASLLKSAGYATAMIGKSGLACRSDDGDLPNRKGFDEFFGYLDHRSAHRYYPPSLWENGNRVEYPGNRGGSGTDYSGDLFRTRALRYLEENAGGPFFLHLSLQQPHADLNVPSRWKQPHVGRFEEEPFGGNDWYRAERHPKATFVGMVQHLDDTVGSVLAKLEELDLAENTLVLFTSDNGPMSEGGGNRHNFQSSGGLRGGKRDLYEGGVRVPMIAWWPGTIRAGGETDHVSAFWDFLPTACQLAGVPLPGAIDGISYAPTLRGRGDQEEHDFLYWELYEAGGKQAVRCGDWKGIRQGVHKDLNAPIELYDLGDDLAETNDVAKQHPAIVDQVKRLMRQARVESNIIRFRSEERARQYR